MKTAQARAAALLISLFLVVLPGAAINTGGYTVAPATAGDITGPQQDPVPVSFWDLGIRKMLIAIALSFCPLFVYPIEIVFFARILAALGYRKVCHDAVRWNLNRQKIYDCIAANPGIRFHSLERLTMIKEGTVKYHLRILEMKRRISSIGRGRSARYFENNGLYNEMEKKVFRHLQDPTERRILEILANYPQVSRKEIADGVGVAGPTISWHTKRLSGDGIITTCREWRAVRYTLCPAGAEIIRQYFGKGPGTPAGSEPEK